MNEKEITTTTKSANNNSIYQVKAQAECREATTEGATPLGPKQQTTTLELDDSTAHGSNRSYSIHVVVSPHWHTAEIAHIKKAQSTALPQVIAVHRKTILI